MIQIASREAKGVLAKYLGETCRDHLETLKKLAVGFGSDTVIELPEDPVLRAKLEELRNVR